MDSHAPEHNARKRTTCTTTHTHTESAQLHSANKRVACALSTRAHVASLALNPRRYVNEIEIEIEIEIEMEMEMEMEMEVEIEMELEMEMEMEIEIEINECTAQQSAVKRSDARKCAHARNTSHKALYTKFLLLSASIVARVALTVCLCAFRLAWGCTAFLLRLAWRSHFLGSATDNLEDFSTRTSPS